MRRWAILMSTWLIATTVATGLAWTSVDAVLSAVGDDVRGAGAVPAAAPRDLVGAPIDSTTGAPVHTASTSPVIGPTGAPSLSPAVDPTKVRTQTSAGTGSTTSRSAPRSTDATLVTTAPAPTTSTSAPPAVRQATYGTEGGSATVRCTTATAIELLTATPADGWRVEVGDSGPDEVEVHFSSARRDAEVHARCVDGDPRRAD